MNLSITRSGTGPAIRAGNERQLEELTRRTAGTLGSPYGLLEWDKYFVTHRTHKKREDFVIIRTGEVPPLDETFARLNRAAALGKRVTRHASAILGARLNPGNIVPEEAHEGDAPSSTDMKFGIEFPMTVSDLAAIDELDIRENGDGLFWLRLASANGRFEVFADNPATQEHPSLAVIVPTETPGAINADPEHIKWQCADALLTPLEAELPGALGDLSLRSALLDLRPGVTTI